MFLRLLEWLSEYRRLLLALLLLLVVVQIPSITYDSGPGYDTTDTHYYSEQTESGQEADGILYVNLESHRQRFLLGDTARFRVRVENAGDATINGALRFYIIPQFGLISEREISLKPDAEDTYTFTHRAGKSAFTGSPPYDVFFRAELGNASPSLRGSYVAPPSERTAVSVVVALLAAIVALLVVPSVKRMIEQIHFDKKNRALAEGILDFINTNSSDNTITAIPEWVVDRDPIAARHLLIQLDEIRHLAASMYPFIRENKSNANPEEWVCLSGLRESFLDGDTTQTTQVLEKLDARREIFIAETNPDTLSFFIPRPEENRSREEVALSLGESVEGLYHDPSGQKWDDESKHLAGLMIESAELNRIFSEQSKSQVTFSGQTYTPIDVIEYLRESYLKGNLLAVRLSRVYLSDFVNLYEDIEEISQSVSRRDYPEVYERIQSGLETANLTPVQSGIQRYNGLKKIEEINRYIETLTLNTTNYCEKELREQIDAAKQSEDWDDIERVLKELENLADGIWEGDDVYKYSWQEFEYLIAKLWADRGYSTTVTQGSGDSGIDVIAESAGERVLIQTKQNSPGNKVGRPVVQKTAGALMGRNANRAVIVTTAAFTQTAVEEAQRSPGLIRLVSGQELLELLNESRLPPPD